MLGEGSDRGRFSGRVALVSGGASGIGSSVVTRLVAEGARVLIADVADSDGMNLARSLGGRAHFVRVDVRNRSDWEFAVESSQTVFGSSPTLLVHSAGVMTGGSIADPDEDAFRLAYDVNALGPVLGTAACIPGMRAAATGSVVLLSSIASLTGAGGFVPYAMSKSVHTTYARCAARELGHDGIRVNVVVPGGVETPLNSGPAFAALDRSAWFGRMPVPRIGQPDEIAGSILYLLSDDASFVTGTSLTVDGGQVHGPLASWAQDSSHPSNRTNTNDERDYV
ncbi:SDR family NAD(P)-dependent oxidoreductase [Rhodococcus jostii]|uniref:3alpha(Or 20beta)-hydroxysteroid dehydrogenase n=1 Tax=Rhodococcus jostii TaxID=132919 RepID=A0A1H4IMJ0_RHOJO|nr:SDR family oxidoreductase [Rhodococcus jostii]SEB35183.1 3alpha(or 20beta)-hydroxysteroid dehydrogenase [Rhodococcus jostii]